MTHMADDEVLGSTRPANHPQTLVAEVFKAGEAPEVAIEATYAPTRDVAIPLIASI